MYEAEAEAEAEAGHVRVHEDIKNYRVARIGD